MTQIWPILPGQLDLKSFFVLWSRSNPFGVLRKRINPPHSDPIHYSQIPIPSNPTSMQSNRYPLNPNNPTIQSNANVKRNATHPMQSNPMFYRAENEIPQSNAIQQKYATSNPIQSTSNAIESISTHSKQSNHSKQRKCEPQRNQLNAIQSNPSESIFNAIRYYNQVPIQSNPTQMQSNRYPLNPKNPIIESDANVNRNATIPMQSNPITRYPLPII